MKLKTSKDHGDVLIDGARIGVTFDIPGLGEDDAPIAGGVVWFNPEHRSFFRTGGTFRLETTDGSSAEGTITRRHSESASVTVAPAS
jgi:hypothetical protein